MNSIEVRYFALFREKAGKESEILKTNATTYKELYQYLCLKYGFDLPPEMIQVAVNDEFSQMHLPVRPDSRIVFIPPVAGG